jgi:hypothetical protein
MRPILFWPTVPFPPAIKFLHGTRAITGAVKATHYAPPATRVFPQHRRHGKRDMTESAAPASTRQCMEYDVPAGWRILEKRKRRHEHKAGATKEGKTCDGLLASGEEEGRLPPWRRTGNCWACPTGAKLRRPRLSLRTSPVSAPNLARVAHPHLTRPLCLSQSSPRLCSHQARIA